MKPTLRTIKLLAQQFLDPNVPDDKLMISIRSSVNVEQIVKLPSDAVDFFIKVMMSNPTAAKVKCTKILKMHHYDNFLYTIEHKSKADKHMFCLHDVNHNHV